MSLLDYCSRYFTDRLPVKDRIVFKISTSFVFSFFVFLPFLFFILGPLPPYVIVSQFLYTLLLALSVLVQLKNFLVQDETLRALVTGRSLFKLPLSGTTFLLTPDTAVLSHSSEFLLKPFSVLLPTLRCCWRLHWLTADDFYYFLVLNYYYYLLFFWGGGGGGERLGEGGGSEELRARERERGCVCVMST